MRFAKFIEKLRDRVVHRSQIGKRKLDRSAVRRRLDDALMDLGERWLSLARAGRVEVPLELAKQVETARHLDDEVRAIDRRLEELRSESQDQQHQPSTT